MKNREVDRSTERYEAMRLYIREVPLGPMPGFSLVIPRCVVHILIPDRPISDGALEEIAIEQKNRVLSFGKDYCAMAFHFWTEKQKKAKLIRKEAAAAIVDYAPDGKWEDALKAPIGDYTKHAFNTISNTLRKELEEDENGTHEA